VFGQVKFEQQNEVSMKPPKATRETMREQSLRRELAQIQRSLRKSEARCDKLVCGVGERKREEAVLRDNEERLQRLFRDAPGGIVVVSCQGRIMEVNPAFCKFLGYSERELIGRKILDITHPEDRGVTSAAMRRLRGSGPFTSRLEKRCLHKNGQTRWFDVSVSKVSDENGKFAYSVAQVMDITARKLAEEASRKSEDKYRLLVETINEGLAICDEHERITFINDGLCRMLGYSRKELIGQRTMLMFDKANWKLMRKQIALRRKGRDDRYEITFRKKDGNPLFVVISPNPIYNDQGRYCGNFAVITDLTERKRNEELQRQRAIEQAQREDLERQGAILNVIPDPAWLKDASGRFLAVNTAWCRFTKVAAQDALGKTVYDVFPSAIARNLDKEDLQVIRSRKQVRDERTLSGEDDELQWYDTIKRPIVDAQGRVIGTAGIARDITLRRRAQEALGQSEEKYRQLFATETDAIMLADAPTGQFIDMNESACRLYGYTREEFLRRKQLDVTAEREESAASIKETIRKKRIFVPLRYHKKKDGTTFPVEVAANIFSVQGKEVICMAVRDITDRMLAAEALRAARAKLISAREEERKRLSRELHDSLAQKLVAVHLRLQSFKDQFSSSLDSAKTQALEELGQQYQSAFDEMRHISGELYPTSLEMMGLCAALQQLKRDMESNHTRVVFRCAPDVGKARYPLGTEISLYRIAQEAMSNAMRHGKPRNVDMSVTYDKGCLQLTVTNDGKSFDRDNANHNGLGLISMQERAEAVGGTLQVTSQSGRTCVEARVPVAKVER
jgi:PAS domain S-box-containing protein